MELFYNSFSNKSIFQTVTCIINMNYVSLPLKSGGSASGCLSGVLACALVACPKNITYIIYKSLVISL